MLKLYPLYEFADDANGDPCDGVRPLAGEVPIEHVYRSKRLIELGGEMPFNEAFAVWASETLGLYDTAHRLAAETDINVDVLEAARGRVVQVMTEQSTTGSRFCDTQPVLREALRPFIEQHMNMRTTSVYLGLPLAEIVKVQIGAKAGRRCEAIADLEEAVLDGALERESQRDLLNRLGLKDSWALLRHVCEIHDVSPKDAAKVRSAA